MRVRVSLSLHNKEDSTSVRLNVTRSDINAVLSVVLLNLATGGGQG